MPSGMLTRFWLLTVRLCSLIVSRSAAQLSWHLPVLLRKVGACSGSSRPFAVMKPAWRLSFRAKSRIFTFGGVN